MNLVDKVSLFASLQSLFTTFVVFLGQVLKLLQIILLQFFEMQRSDALKSLDIYRRAGQQVCVVCLQCFAAQLASSFTGVWHSFVIVGWETVGVLWSMQGTWCWAWREAYENRAGFKSSLVSLYYCFNRLASNMFIHVDNVASCIILASHGGVRQRST